ncbi:hypothetical protein [Salinibaculum rarum]|uniref:hypothetical protein n=1 Tax=Salinibaculum rarum TaxID=3058903 RepID=UPI00265D7AFB|nr:hypothetical protein [Salinibaculum sp. KK48]
MPTNESSTSEPSATGADSTSSGGDRSTINLVNPAYDTSGPTDLEKKDADVDVIWEDGDRQLVLRGHDQAHLDEAVKERIFVTYKDLLLDLDRVEDEYPRPDNAWHIGRVLDEYDVGAADTPYQFRELDQFNPIGEMFGRRLYFARGIYEFWPDQGYDESHSVTALGELGWHAIKTGRIEEAERGYARLCSLGKRLKRHDGRIWKYLGEDGDKSLQNMVSYAAERYGTKESVTECTLRLVVLTNQSPRDIDGGELQDLIDTACSESE